MKKWIAYGLILVCALSTMACTAYTTVPTDPSTTTRTFLDSTGREVIIDSKIKRIAVSGPLSQMIVFALAPEKMVGIATKWDASAAKYLSETDYQMPVLGQLYGGKGELNLEELLAASPQIVIDVGEPKDSIAEDMDRLQTQTGIPFVHIDATLESMGEAYRMLGKLLDMETKAEPLATYCDNIYSHMIQIADQVKKVNLLYITGSDGLHVIAKGSYHAEVIDLLSNNLAVVDDPSSKGTGNEVDMEQILSWNPDVILFSPESIYETVGTDPTWQNLSAIENGTYYEVPMGPYNWMGFPPSVQRLLGMMWMVNLLYPDATDFNLYEQVSTYYDLFYHCKLPQEQYHALVSNSLE